jgi:hypothetical protein
MIMNHELAGISELQHHPKLFKKIKILYLEQARPGQL